MHEYFGRDGLHVVVESAVVKLLGRHRQLDRTSPESCGVFIGETSTDLLHRMDLSRQQLRNAATLDSDSLSPSMVRNTRGSSKQRSRGQEERCDSSEHGTLIQSSPRLLHDRIGLDGTNVTNSIQSYLAWSLQLLAHRICSSFLERGADIISSDVTLISRMIVDSENALTQYVESLHGGAVNWGLSRFSCR